jgi:hypothetical protein
MTSLAHEKNDSFVWMSSAPYSPVFGTRDWRVLRIYWNLNYIKNLFQQFAFGLAHTGGSSFIDGIDVDVPARNFPECGVLRYQSVSATIKVVYRPGLL